MTVHERPRDASNGKHCYLSIQEGSVSVMKTITKMNTRRPPAGRWNRHDGCRDQILEIFVRTSSMVKQEFDERDLAAGHVIFFSALWTRFEMMMCASSLLSLLSAESSVPTNQAPPGSALQLLVP